MEPFLLFSGNSHPLFASKVAEYLGTELGGVDFKPFPDGEISVQILDNVRGREVFVIQTIAIEPNNYLMELLIMVDALKRASAKCITAIIPYFGYARQDRKDKPRVPISAKLIADLLQTAGVARVLTMDLHAGQIQGFFDIPVDNLFGSPYLAEALAKENLEKAAVVAPDLGAIKKARAFAKQLNLEFAVIDKRRLSIEQVEVITIIGDVKGRDVILVDDLCSTGGTLVSAANACKEAGAERILAAVTHGLFVGKAEELLSKSPIEKIFVSDTVPFPKELLKNKISLISVAPLFGEAVRCILEMQSISSIFNST